MSNPDAQLEYKLILDFVVREIEGVVRVIQPESLCYYLLSDTLKHVGLLVDTYKEENPGV